MFGVLVFYALGLVFGWGFLGFLGFKFSGGVCLGVFDDFLVSFCFVLT